MVDPLENNGFKHELKFYDFDMDWYETPEPIGFIGSKFTMKRDKGWARDVNYFAIDGVEFPKKDGKMLSVPRQINPEGDNSDYLDYGFEWLMAARALKGSEMKVGYRISAFGVVFREFQLDTRNEQLTNGVDWFRCKLIEIGRVADHKRNEKNTFNAYNDKNWKDETITPIESFNYLCKATPVINTSEFKISSNFFDENDSPLVFNTFLNPSQVISPSEINDTLGWLNPVVGNPDPSDLLNFGLIKAVVDTTNITVKFDVDFDYVFTGDEDQYLRLLLGIEDGVFQEVLVRIKDDGASGTVTQTYSIDIDLLDVGKKLICAYEIVGEYRILFRKNTITVTATEREIDLVIPAVLYPDLIKQSVKYVNDLPVLLGEFRDDGKFHYEAVFNRSAIGGKKQMYATPELVFSHLDESWSDAEFSSDWIDIRQREGFYENIEIGSFLINPEEDYSEPFNEEYLINNFQFGYKKYEQEKTEKQTAKSIHTQAEFLPRNDSRNADKKIELNFVRDPKYKQTVFNLEIKSPNTSTDRDEDLFIEAMTRIAPGTINKFTRTLLMRWVDGKLEILNRNTLGTNEDAILNWNSIGLTVGGLFEILSTVNIGSYTVFSIKDDGSILTLTPSGAVTQFSGNATITITHNYTNVIWQTRTTEGFTLAPIGFSNLTHTIKRDMIEGYDYFATVLHYAKADMKNSFFKNFNQYDPAQPFDGRETQLTTETSPVVENAPIVYSDLSDPTVEPILVKSGIYAPYLDVVDWLNRYKYRKGFIRIHDGKNFVVFVYPKLFDYTLSSGKAEINGEKKYLSQNLKVDIIEGLVYINDAPYDLSGVADWFRTANDSIMFYDKKSHPLSKYYNYNFVFLNGTKYPSLESLVSALNVYQWT